VVHLSEEAGVELPADLHREVVSEAWIAVPPLGDKGDRLGDDVVRGEHEVGKPLPSVCLEDLVDAGMVFVVRADVGERKPVSRRITRPGHRRGAGRGSGPCPRARP
jgi:hypothetical protein